MSAGATIAVCMPDDVWDHFYTDAERRELGALGIVLRLPVPERIDDPANARVLGRADVAVTGWSSGRFTEAALDLAPHLRAIVHTGGGVQGVCSPAVFRRGIRVASQTAINAEPVAQYCLAMIVLASKDVFGATRQYRATRRKPGFFSRRDIGLVGARVGLVSSSHISRRLAELLRPLGAQTWMWSKHLSGQQARELGVRPASLERIFSECDVISVHTAALPENRHMIGAPLLRLIKPGATLLNTARGMVIDQRALVRELRDGRFQAILDVTDPEPLAPDDPLFDLPNAMVTPHWAGSLGRELQAMARGAIRDVREYLAGAEHLTGEVTEGDFAGVA